MLLFREGHGKISVFVVKMALATMCGGKILDKLRCKQHSKALFYFLIVKNEIKKTHFTCDKSANCLCKVHTVSSLSAASENYNTSLLVSVLSISLSVLSLLFLKEEAVLA